MNAVLFEAWEKCQGNWTKSEMLMTIRSVNRSKKMGVRVWMTRAEAVTRFGEAAADAIILRKLQDETLKTTQVRDHPEAPGCPELRQFLILDTSKEVEESEDILEQP